MILKKLNLFPLLLSGLLVTSAPAFAQAAGADDIVPSSELGIAADLPEVSESLIAEADETPVLLAFAPAGPAECQDDALALTDTQLEKIHSIKNQFLDAVGPKMLEICKKHRQLKDALFSANFDPAQAKVLQSEINTLKDQVSDLRLQKHIDCLSVLTPEQRKEFHNRMNRMHCCGQEHGHHMMMHGQGMMMHGPGMRG